MFTTARYRTGAYWTCTAIICTESVVGGSMDLLRLAPFYPMLLELGYPGYLATFLGAAKLAAAAVLLAPGLRRLKEWAYAGILINMLGAAASQVAAHQQVGNVIPPLAFAAVTLASWSLRPPARRL